jgi:hypothetical protein
MKKFTMKADIEFSAENIEDAQDKLAYYFEDLLYGRDNLAKLIESGKIEILPKEAE